MKLSETSMAVLVECIQKAIAEDLNIIDLYKKLEFDTSSGMIDPANAQDVVGVISFGNKSEDDEVAKILEDIE